MFDKEYRKIFDLLLPQIASDSEISIEANPEDISEERLQYWRSLGINRLSMGVQSFLPKGLKFLTRNHQVGDTVKAIELALKYFPNLNIDLIYGWEGESVENFMSDIARAESLGINHLSLYNLTYEPGTTLGRKESRGLVHADADEHLEKLYLGAVEKLRGPWIHDEVSNWSREGHSCKHNWIYWQGGYFWGLGSGAHGYLPSDSSHGIRFSFPKDFRRYLNSDLLDTSQESSLSQDLRALGAIVDEERGAEDWLLEFVGSGLRSRMGVSISHIESILKCKFLPSKILQFGIDKGLVDYRKGRLYLSPSEWFRENRWSLELAMSFNYS